MLCQSCGTENRSEAKYCGYCGDILALPKLKAEDVANLTPEAIDRIMEEYDHEIERQSQQMRWGEGLLGLLLFFAIVLVLVFVGVYATEGQPSALGKLSCIMIGGILLIIVISKLAMNAGWRQRQHRVEDAKIRFLRSTSKQT